MTDPITPQTNDEATDLEPVEEPAEVTAERVEPFAVTGFAADPAPYLDPSA